MRIDLSILEVFFLRDAGAVIFDLLAIFGWAALAWLILNAMIYSWKKYKEDVYKANWEWVLLAIDVPLENAQTPKAVEQMFSHLSGAFNQPNLAEKFRQGFKQEWFSFEIISLEGYIQFLVRTEAKFRDLVEGAVYAQYPDAEITEVEDYVDAAPNKYPDDEYEIFAEDYGLAEDSAYPIRTYSAFEHNISKDTVLKDPMGTFLESFTRIGPGEQMWFQMIVKPISNAWKEKTIEKIKQLIGDVSVKNKVGALVPLAKEGNKGWEELKIQLFGSVRAEGGDSKPEEPNKMRYLTPGQKVVIEAMEEKIAKIGFKTKMRGIYLARKEVFRPTRGIHALRGAISQFNVPSANSLVPTYKAQAFYFLKNWRINYRKNLLMRAYKKRKGKIGGNWFILNIEELATVWHFPMSHVKTPLLQKTLSKHAEPPSGLPVEMLGQSADFSGPAEADKKEEPTARYQTDSGHVSYGGGMKFG